MAYQMIQAMDSPVSRTAFPDDSEVAEDDIGAHYRSQFPLDDAEEGELNAIERDLLS